MPIDTHQHFWRLSGEPMQWMRPEHDSIARDFEPADLRPLLDACAIDRTILVQSACADSDTDGLNTILASPDWAAADLVVAVEVGFDCLGHDRLMCGSDWPVSLLNGGYDKVWRETVAALTTVAGDAASRRILEDTPAHLYGIAETTGALTTPTPGATDGRAH